MTTTTNSFDQVQDALLAESKSARDALSVKQVFGDAYECGDRTIIPVAVVSGGGGGGSGEGIDQAESGRGFGSGFGLNTRPVGVYEVGNYGAEWKPAVDVNRIVKGGQVLGGIIAVCVAIAYMMSHRQQ